MTEIKPTTGAAPDPAASAPESAAATAAAPIGGAARLPVARRAEALYFALRNKKVIGGLSVIVLLFLLGLVGPLLTEWGPRQRNVGEPFEAPSATHWLGTTWFGQDVFTQLTHGIRASFLVAVLAAVLAAAIGMLIGFVAGYRGGWVDEILMMFTNIILVLPVFVVLIVAMAYLRDIAGFNNRITQAVVIGAFAWPWVARAVRAQTLSLRTRDFVDLARLTGVRPLRIIVREIAPNMASYLVMVFVLLFAGAVLFAAALDFLGLGPRGGMSLGLMLNVAVQWNAALHQIWWWFIPPGAAITAITASAYVTNVGLDEVFNPKLREM